MADHPKHTLLHNALVFANQINRTLALILPFILITFIGSAAWLWISRTHDVVLGCVVGLGLAIFIAGDWLMLAWLPRAGRSFGPVELPLLALAAARWALSIAAAFIPAAPISIAALVTIGNLALTGNVLDSLWAEPFRLGVTRLEIKSPKLASHPPLRVLHVSDLHIERITARERKLLALVQELRPDLIVFTGDFLNLSYTHDEQAFTDCREVLSKLCAPLGVYVISGSPSVDPTPVVDRLLEGSNIRRLDNEIEPLKMSSDDELNLALIGITCTGDTRVDGRALERAMASVSNSPSTPFTLLLYHSPDLMPQATRVGVDLYLCGHTHGGQIRLPFIGGVVTSSRFWKRYEMGRYVERNTTLYVSRGIGMEGMGAPRARFLCPPEIELFELRGPENG